MFCIGKPLSWNCYIWLTCYLQEFSFCDYSRSGPHFIFNTLSTKDLFLVMYSYEFKHTHITGRMSCLLIFSWLENPRTKGEYRKEGIPIDTLPSGVQIRQPKNIKIFGWRQSFPFPYLKVNVSNEYVKIINETCIKRTLMRPLPCSFYSKQVSAITHWLLWKGMWDLLECVLT